MTNSSKIVLDTNILIYSVIPSSPNLLLVNARLDEIDLLGMEGVLTTHIVHEFARAALRPVVDNGLGWTKDRILRQTAKFCSVYTLLEDDNLAHDEWLRLFRTISKLRSRDIYDLKIAASMIRHNVSYILTNDPDVFSKVSGIQVVSLTDPLPAQSNTAP